MEKKKTLEKLEKNHLHFVETECEPMIGREKKAS